MGSIVPFNAIPLCQALPRPVIDGTISVLVLGNFAVVEIIEGEGRLQAWVTAEHVSMLCNAIYRKIYSWLDDYHGYDQDGSYAQLWYQPLFRDNASIAITLTKGDGADQIVGIILSKEGQQTLARDLQRHSGKYNKALADSVANGS